MKDMDKKIENGKVETMKEKLIRELRVAKLLNEVKEAYEEIKYKEYKEGNENKLKKTVHAPKREKQAM